MSSVLVPLPEPARAPADSAGAVDFAHNAERQLAKLLDFYGIAWEYEPRTFVLRRHDDGQPAEGFTPDFYLPGHDLFIEITTLSQRLVTKKNAKVRRLRELHPEVKVRILYQRDYVGLLEKYGLEAPQQWERPARPAGCAPLGGQQQAEDLARPDVPAAS